MPADKQTPTYARLRLLLEKGYKLSKLDAMEWLGCVNVTARQTLRQLHKDGLTHIIAWGKSGNQFVPIYAWGKKMDAPRPLSKEKKQTIVRKSMPRKTRVSKQKIQAASNQIFNLIVGRTA